MKRTKKNRQADCLQTGKSERTAARAAKCVTDYGQENTGVDFRKDKGRDKPLSTFLQASEIKTRQCIGKRKGFGTQPFRPHNVPFVMLGAFLLWFGWFGFSRGR